MKVNLKKTQYKLMRVKTVAKLGETESEQEGIWHLCILSEV